MKFSAKCRLGIFFIIFGSFCSIFNYEGPIFGPKFGLGKSLSLYYLQMILWQTGRTLMKCCTMQHFIWVLPVCQSIICRLYTPSRIKRVSWLSLNLSHFILVFTVCKSTQLGVSRIQRFKMPLPETYHIGSVQSFTHAVHLFATCPWHNKILRHHGTANEI